VDVELVESGLVAGVSKLDLEFQLVCRHRFPADRTFRSDAWPAPRSIRAPGRELTVQDRSSRLFSKDDDDGLTA
jgi:hypothetical protein